MTLSAKKRNIQWNYLDKETLAVQDDQSICGSQGIGM